MVAGLAYGTVYGCGLASLSVFAATVRAVAQHNDSRAGSSAFVDSFGGATPPSNSALFSGLNFPPGYTPQNALLSMAVTSTGGSVVTGKNSLNEQRAVNFVDTLSMVISSHQLKIGADYRWLASLSGPRNYAQLLTFTGVLGSTGTLQSGSASATLFTGASVAEVVKNFSLSAQDTWRATPRFTLTYGLRWEVNPPFANKDDKAAFFTVLNADTPSALTLAPRGTALYDTAWGNVAPRLGMAYTLNQTEGWETVLRGGVGLFYDIGSSYYEGVAPGGWPFSTTRSLGTVAVPLTPAQAIPAPFSSAPPVNGTIFVGPNLKMPRTVQFNVAMEQSLGTGQSMSLTYVGAIGRDMIYSYNLSAPNPTFTSVRRGLGRYFKRDQVLGKIGRRRPISSLLARP